MDYVGNIPTDESYFGVRVLATFSNAAHAAVDVSTIPGVVPSGFNFDLCEIGGFNGGLVVHEAPTSEFVIFDDSYNAVMVYWGNPTDASCKQSTDMFFEGTHSIGCLQNSGLTNFASGSWFGIGMSSALSAAPYTHLTMKIRAAEGFGDLKLSLTVGNITARLTNPLYSEDFLPINEDKWRTFTVPLSDLLVDPVGGIIEYFGINNNDVKPVKYYVDNVKLVNIPGQSRAIVPNYPEMPTLPEPTLDLEALAAQLKVDPVVIIETETINPSQGNNVVTLTGTQNGETTQNGVSLDESGNVIANSWSVVCSLVVLVVLVLVQ